MKKVKIFFTTILLLLPLFTWGQNVKLQDVDSIVVRFDGKWRDLFCVATPANEYIMSPHDEYLITDRRAISKLVKAVNNLDKGNEIKQTSLFDVDCMIFLIQSDMVSSVFTVNKYFSNIYGHKCNSNSLPSIITQICGLAYKKKNHKPLTSNTIPYDGGEPALLKHVKMAFRKTDWKECPSGKHKLVVSCRSDKMGNTTNVNVFYAFPYMRKVVPKELKEKIEHVFYRVKWQKDRYRWPSDDIIVNLSLML